jgi:poly-gamma-glutamate synthesis protein (capsule biosynthesis protein)
MQDPAADSRLTKRKKSRQQQIRGLLLLAIFVVGALVGWLLLGWLVFPLNRGADPRDMSLAAKTEYVLTTVEAWTLNQDTALARERLGEFSREELTTILQNLIDERNRSGQPLEAARLLAFATSLGLNLTASTMAQHRDVPHNVAPATIIAEQVSPTPAPSPSIANSPTPPAPSARISIAATISGTIGAAVVDWAKANNIGIVVLPANGEQNETADVSLSFQPTDRPMLLAQRVYVVADRFATLRTSVTLANLQALWQGQTLNDGTNTLFIGNDLADGFDDILGTHGATVKRVPPSQIAARLWSQPNALALVPFDELTPKILALPLDGQNVLSRDLKLDAYPLVLQIYANGDPALTSQLLDAIHPKIPLTNRDPDRITTLMMTGVTAISRTTALKIEQKKDNAYPARVVAPVLAAADITHVSNEVPFTDRCQAVLGSLVLCSKPAYIASLKLIGTDIVGLTGNHLLDYGADAFTKTIDLYDAEHLRYYGGGRNADDASKTLFLQDHGNTLAFLGTNSFGPPNDWATADRPGAQRYNVDILKKAIADARKKADVVLVEHQAEETYDYEPSANNRIEFHVSFDAGADVVTGVQAHQPQGFEFSNDGRRIILYGLGNLFFDQMQDEGTRQGIIVRHTIYAGHLLQTELLTTMLEDYAQPRWTTPAERAKLLNALLAVSAIK